MRLVQTDRQLSLHDRERLSVDDRRDIQERCRCTSAGRVHGFQNLPKHGTTNIKAFNLKDVKEDIQTATTTPVSITLAGNKPQSDSLYRPWSI